MPYSFKLKKQKIKKQMSHIQDHLKIEGENMKKGINQVSTDIAEILKAARAM